MPFDQLRRREFLGVLGGAAAAWPISPRAQQGERMRRVGVLMSTAADDAEGKARIAAFLSALEKLGWVDGRNVRIDTRWPAGGMEELRKYAAELLALAPEVVVAAGAGGLTSVQAAAQTVPIVFVLVPDPVGAGFVASLARPGGNATGFASPEYGVSGKLLELLKEIAPGVKRVGVLRDRDVPSGPGQFGAIQSVAPPFGVELFPIGLRDASEIERGIAEFARARVAD
jgi:putative ABC transport system substrate-binding protein